MMIKYIAFIALIVQAYGQDGCTINIVQLKPEPLVFDEFYNFLYPPKTNEEGDFDITIPDGQTIIITCPGGNLETDQGPESSTIFATCNQHGELVYEDKILNASSLSCSNYRLESVRVTEQTCANNSKTIVVGYEISLDINFVPLITICFDLVARIPVWINHHLTSSSFALDYGITMRLYDEDIFNLNVSLGGLYDEDYHKGVINDLVGLPVYSNKYEDYLPLQFVPLALSSNFVYKTQMNASDHFMNGAPQWRLLQYPTNWVHTEDSVIAFVKANRIELEIYTGTYGVSTLPHAETGEDVEIYLYTEGNIKAIPMPEVFWKLIFDPLTRRATAFLTLNNPFQTDFSKSILCDDISDVISWLTWVEKENPEYGYSYACTYHELKEAIPDLPDLDVIGILA